MEDYLEAIAELIAVDGHAHTKEIAQKLNVKMPSVTGALRQLVQLGYIVYNTHYPVQLTEEGKRAAEQVRKRAAVAVELAGNGLSPEERETFYKALELITTNLQKLSREGLPQG